MPTPSFSTRADSTGKFLFYPYLTGILALALLCFFALAAVYCFHQKEMGDRLHEQAAWQCTINLDNYFKIIGKFPSGLVIGNGEEAYAWNVSRQKRQHYGGFLADLRREFGLAGALLFPVLAPDQYSLVFIPESVPASVPGSESEFEEEKKEAGIWNFSGKKLLTLSPSGIEAGEIVRGLRQAAVDLGKAGVGVPFQVQGEYFLATPLFLPGLDPGVTGWLYMLEQVSGRRVLSFWGMASLLAAVVCLLVVCKALTAKYFSQGGNGRAGNIGPGQCDSGQDKSEQGEAGQGEAEQPGRTRPLSPLFEAVFTRGRSACVIVTQGSQRPYKANSAALALFQVKRAQDIDLGLLRSLAAYFPLQREWKGKGELMTFPLAGQVLYCEVLRYPLDDANAGECCIIRDITHIVGLRGEIRKRSRMMRIVLDHLPSYISMKDEHCRLVFYNIAYSQLFDCGPEELIGKREYPGWSEETMRQALRTDVLALGSDSTVVYDLEIPVGKTSRIHSIAKRRIAGPDNETFIVTVGTDITERVELRRQLEELKARAEAANIAKTQFLARMSHEIRTPMNAIIGTSYLALTSSPKGKLKQYLETIQRSARNLLGIINDILDISKVEAGEMRLSITPFNLASVLADVEEQITVLLHDAPITFVCDYEPLSHYLLGDSLRLGQVLLNLCNNAVKFTDAGSITLRVKNQEQRGENIRLLFEVEDTGIGIAPKDRERLFDSFQQVDGGPASRYGGTGLGLAISQQFVNLMGSRIEVDGEVGKGTRFYFTLVLPMAGALPDPALHTDEARKLGPFDIPGEQGRHTAKSASTGTGEEGAKAQGDGGNKEGQAEEWPPLFPGATVLVVEDNEINREIAVEILEQMEIAVDTAENGKAALEAVQTRKYDLVLMDVQMPVMDGLTASRAIRGLENKFVADLPIVALTANALSEDHARCQEAGMNAFLGKPIDLNALVATLAHWLGAYQVR